MRISDSILETLLGRASLATPEQITSLKEEATRSKRSLQETVIDQRMTDDKTLTKLFAEYASIPFVELDALNIPPDVLTLIPERIARQYNAILFQVDADGVRHLAMEDPDDVQAVNFLQKEIGLNSRIHIATRENILAALESYRGDVNKELNEVIDVQREQKSDLEVVSEKDIAEDSPIAQTVNLLLEYAIRSHASDVHIEPREDFVQIRFRVAGILK
jgi:type IV pilus assembly protein PilB